MDLNATTTTFINNNIENERMFNAIRNKFAAKTEAETFNSAKQNIPGGNDMENINLNEQTVQVNNSNTQLNEFLLKQLQENKTNCDLSGKNIGFVLPKLQAGGSAKAIVKFELPVLKTQTENTSISTLTVDINELKIEEHLNQCETKFVLPKAFPIDLTSALAANLEKHQGTPPTRDFIRPEQNDNELDFEIPFIDCDRLDVSRNHKNTLPTSNEYCVTDASKLLLQHTLSEPSAIGRSLCIDDCCKYLDPLPLKYFAPQYRCQQKAKHNIEPFRFDTNSPDDIVLLALSINQRRHLN